MSALRTADWERRRSRMVEQQLRRRGISDERVLAAMARVPREEFVPAQLRDRAYDDAALPIGEGQTISQPFIVAAMCELLGLAGAEHVLDVGTGSGYAAAVLDELAAWVVSIERVAVLGDRAREALERTGHGRRGAPRRRRDARRPRPGALRCDLGRGRDRGRADGALRPAGTWEAESSFPAVGPAASGSFGSSAPRTEPSRPPRSRAASCRSSRTERGDTGSSDRYPRPA